MINAQIDFFDKLAAEDFKGCIEIFSDNAVFIFPGVPQMEGKRKIEFILKRIYNKFKSKSGKFSVKKEFTGNDEKNNKFLIIEWENEAEFKTGKQYKNSGASILLFNEYGKVVYFRDYLNSTDFSDT